MGKKARLANAPKVQAPKVRGKQAPGSGGGGMAMPGTNVLIGVGLAAAAALVVVIIVVFAGSPATDSNVSTADVANVRAAVEAAGGTLVAKPADPSARHMSDPNQAVTYRTFPASSGTHNPTTSIWGNYRLPVDPRQAVHNLEHGGIVIWTGPDVSAADRAAIDAFYEENPNGLVVTPIEDSAEGVTYPKHDKPGDEIQLTVWTAKAGFPEDGTAYIATLPKFDEAAVVAFRDAFRGKGPERFPVSEMVPGVN